MGARSDLVTTSSPDAGLAKAVADTLALHERLRRVAIDSDEGVDVVHDLRVALRRCRSLAQGLAAVDVVEAKLWRHLAKTAKGLFGGLGAIRDAHVMRSWTKDLVTAPVRERLLARLDDDIARAAVDAIAAVDAFDTATFAGFVDVAPARAALVRKRRPLLLHLAITRFAEGRALHVEAMRRRTPESLHDTRIGVKRLRYTLDSLLPDLHAVVARPLKKMQAALGDLHDFDVLRARLEQILVDDGVSFDDISVTLAPVDAARDERLTAYKQLATGRTSSWTVIRDVLPVDEVVVERCRRAYVLEVAASLGVDHRHARLAEQALSALAAIEGRVVDAAGRYAAMLAASSHKKRGRRAARDLLGFSDDEKRRLREQMRHDRLVVAAGVAASE